MLNLTQFSAVGMAVLSVGLSALPGWAREARFSQESDGQRRLQFSLLAQADNCRQISSGIPGLNVRRAPSLTAEVVGVVPASTNVAIESLGADGWAPISAPYEGYVSTNYLTTCSPTDEIAAVAPVEPEGDQCRQVMVRSGLNVRVSPNRYSNRLTALPMGTTVQINGPANDNWVQITAPVNGYVAERFLGSCL
jgi:uncharacterized protein YgiM (DUF1202 family)